MSSRFSRSNSLILLASDVVVPDVRPASTSDCLHQPRNVSALMPTRGPIRFTAAFSDRSLSCSRASATRRIARSRSSFGYFLGAGTEPLSRGFRASTQPGSVQGDVGPIWIADTPLRVAVDRRQAQVELDALVAVALGLTADELCTIYRTQFAVLYGYDRNVYFYDANGRLVPNSVLTAWRKKGNRVTEEDRTATHPAGTTYVYELPFITLDREADMRAAYASFAAELGSST